MDGKITREKAQELVECLFIKFVDNITALHSAESETVSGGALGTLRDITIGGVTPNGEDATNEFSFIILDASESVALPEPAIAVRYHSGISPDLILKAIDVVKTGIGYPAFFNDSAYIPWFQNIGYSLERARDYGISGCVGGQLQNGENFQSHAAAGGVLNFSKCLELALYQGIDKNTGKKLGADTPDLSKAENIEDVFNAYLGQVEYVAHKLAEIDNIRCAIFQEYFPHPFCSVLVNGCIENGKDSVGWGIDGSARMLFTGMTNVANSFAAIKKLVFDDKTITMAKLIEACKINFEGMEELRQTLINKAPKYGNDDDYVDALTSEVHVRTSEKVMESAKDFWGYPFYLDASIAGGYFSTSILTGAIPDGKKDGEPTSDASHSPSAGTDRKGPTALLKSVSKIPYTYHALLNQKFLPSFLEGKNKQKFAQYLKTWHDLNIGQIQFNVVDKATLQNAQAHPDEYSNLIVRVAGYSAYFIDLAKPLQDDIIERTEQAFH
jgi:pyruvate-formate lyase